jgi:hypothetical protein
MPGRVSQKKLSQDNSHIVAAVTRGEILFNAVPMTEITNGGHGIYCPVKTITAQQ